MVEKKTMPTHKKNNVKQEIVKSSNETYRKIHLAQEAKYLESRYELALFYGDEEYAKGLRQRIDNIQKEIDDDLTWVL